MDIKSFFDFIVRYNLTTAVTLICLGGSAYAYGQKIVTNHFEHFIERMEKSVEAMGTKIELAILKDRNRL